MPPWQRSWMLDGAGGRLYISPCRIAVRWALEGSTALLEAGLHTKRMRRTGTDAAGSSRGKDRLASIRTSRLFAVAGSQETAASASGWPARLSRLLRLLVCLRPIVYAWRHEGVAHPGHR